jgi:pimeloyl-ACP methyl ester carboxylesterase
MRRALTSQIMLIGCVCALFAACGPGPRRAVAPTYTPTFSAGKCPFKVGEGLTDGKEVMCGVLHVPEDRAHPAGRAESLAVAIFKPNGTAPGSDPVIYLSGGPGGRAVGDFGPIITLANRRILYGNRELILIDQRGTGYSQPSLQCDEVVQLQFQYTNQNLTPADQVRVQNDALRACHERLTKQGIDLSAYTSFTNAADIHDLITALGLQQADLYGVSYGTRLALEVMRAFPQHIRSVVLDSVFPPQVDSFTADPAAFTRIYTVLFQGCAASATCNSAHPNLQAQFNQVVQQLNAQPATFSATDTNTGKTYPVLF